MQQDLTKTKMGKENSKKIKIYQEQNIDYLKPRSNTFDTKKYQIKINRGKINFFGNNTMQRYFEGNESRNEDRKNIFLNTNKLPKIITRISLSNFHKKNNNLEGEMNNNICDTINKFSLFHKTLGNFGFKGITFNSGLSGLRSTNYKFNINNNKYISEELHESLLVNLINRLKNDFSIGVMEADIDGDVDADRITKLTGVPSIQVHTGGTCHLTAQMVEDAIEAFDIKDINLLILENVGNLVCPAEFDTGAHLNLVLLSGSNGFDSSLCFGLAPTLVSREYKGKAGNAVSLFQVIGGVCGSSLAFLTQKIITIISYINVI